MTNDDSCALAIINNYLVRTGFERVKYKKGLTVNSVPKSVAIIREIVKILYVGTGQGFKKMFLYA